MLEYAVWNQGHMSATLLRNEESRLCALWRLVKASAVLEGVVLYLSMVEELERLVVY